MKRKAIRVPMEYEGIINRISVAPAGYRVDIVQRVTAKALAPRLSPIGSFYENRRLGKSIFIKDIAFGVKKGKNCLFLEV